jgi:hypothetical protein
MPRGRVEIQLYTFFNLGTRWRWVVNATPQPLYPRKETWSGWVWETSSPPGFDPWIIQGVASRYTNYAILAHFYLLNTDQKYYSFNKVAW